MKPITGQKLPITKNIIPDIMEKLEMLNPVFHQNSYLSDDAISKITFQVINIANYHNHEEKLIEDIQMFAPKVLALSWCYSMKSDVSLVLRHEGILAKMLIEHDMRQICKKPNAKLDDNQAEIIRKIANEKPQNIILWGSSGTGKTLLLAQALLMKISHYKRQKIDIKVFVSSYSNESVEEPLMKDFKQKYLTNIAHQDYVEFIDFSHLCEGI